MKSHVFQEKHEGEFKHSTQIKNCIDRAMISCRNVDISRLFCFYIVALNWNFTFKNKKCSSR